MTLRLVQVGNSLPHSWQVDLSSTFTAGMVGQLKIQGNSVVIGVSDGTAPLCLLDDIRLRAFTAVAWDETVIVSATGIDRGDGVLVTPIDLSTELDNPNILPETFTSNPIKVQLKPRNGVIVIPAGTPLNLDQTGSGILNACKTTVRYNYQVPNLMLDDTTAGSGRAVGWFQRGIYQTDIFDTTATYPLNANIFVNDKGLLTTKQIAPNYPSIGLVTSPPTSSFAWLEILFL